MSLEAKSFEVEDARERGDVRSEFKLLRTILPMSMRRPQGVYLEDGTVAHDYNEGRLRWQRFFADKLCGRTASMNDIVMSSVRRQADVFSKLVKSPPTIDDIPSVSEIRQQYGSSKRGKGHGEDSLCAEIYRAAPDKLANVYHPLTMKLFARLEEPVSHKGGMMAEILKLATSCSKTCSNSRGVRVSDFSSKTSHGWIRSRIFNSFVNVARPTQHGGVPHKGTTLCAHLSRSVAAYAKQNGLCCTQIYCDVVGAFDALLRQIMLDVPMTDELIAFVLSKLKFEPDSMHKLYEHIKERSFLNTSGVSPYWQHVLAEVHTDTWFSTQGVCDVTLSDIGSIPGDPLGDIMFNFCAIKIHEQIETRLRDACLLHEIPCLHDCSEDAVHDGAVTVTLCDNLYVDDSDFFIVGSRSSPTNAISHVHDASEAMCIIRSTYREHCMELNMKLGKTNAAMSICGSDSKYTWHRIVNELSCSLPLDCPFESNEAVASRDTPKIVKEYKHMGAISNIRLDMQFEVRNRVTSMHTIFRPARNRVFANKALTLVARSRYAESLLESRLLFDAAAWEPMNVTVLGKLSHAYMAPLRAVAGMRNLKTGVHYSNHQVLTHLGRPSVTHKLSLLRLRYLCSFTSQASLPHMRVILHQRRSGSSWLSLVIQDLLWCYNSFECLYTTLHSPITHVQEWFEYIRNNQTSWRGLVVKARIKMQRMPVIDDNVAVADSCFQCDECPRSFRSWSALKGHCRAKHDYTHPIRVRLRTTYCLCCGAQHHTRPRVFKHIAYVSVRCLEYYLQNVDCLSDDEIAEIKSDDAKLKHTFMDVRKPFIPGFA